MIEDLRLGVRLLAKNPGFTIAAALLLAFGLGGNTTIFALLYTVFARPLPAISEPDRLALVGLRDRQRDWGGLSYPFYRDLRDRNRVFSAVAAINFACFHVAEAEGVDRHAEKLCGRL